MNRTAVFAVLLLFCGDVRADTRLAVIALEKSGVDDLADLVQLRLGDARTLLWSNGGWC